MPSGPYSYTLIDPTYSIGTGTFRSVGVSQVNDMGQVLGTFSGSAGSPPFLYSDGGYTNLDVPGATTTIATQLSNTGQVIGRYYDATGGAHAFVYQDGNYSEIAVPDAAFTTALQISSAGKILAEYFDSNGLHPLIDDNGSNTTLSVPGATSTIVRISTGVAGSIPQAINDADQVIGAYVDAAGSHAFLYSDGGYTTLAVPGAASTVATQINNAGQVFGTYTTPPESGPSVTRYFVYSDGAYTPIAVPGATNTTANQINDAGQVAGTYTDPTGTHLFLDTGGTYVTIDPPPGPSPSGSGPSVLSDPSAPPVSLGSSVPSATLVPFSSVSFTQLSNAGDVLGTYYSSGNQPSGSKPFLYSDGTSTDVSVPGAPTTNATRVNDLGHLIGTFSDGTATHAFLATPVGADAMQTSLLATLLPAVPNASAPVATNPDGTSAGAGLLTPTGDNAGSNPQLISLNNQGSSGP